MDSSLDLKFTTGLLIETYLTLLRFADTAFCFVLQIDGLEQPCIKQSIGAIFFFNSICTHLVSLSHFDNSCCISNFFVIIFVTVIHDQWLWFMGKLAINYFYIKVCTLVFRHNSIAYLGDYNLLRALSWFWHMKLLWPSRPECILDWSFQV